MIRLEIEEHGDGGFIRFDDSMLALLDAAPGDALLFDKDQITVRRASGDVGPTFVWTTKPTSESEAVT